MWNVVSLSYKRDFTYMRRLCTSPPSDNNKSTLNYRWLQRFIDFSSSRRLSRSAKIKCDLSLLLAPLISLLERSLLGPFMKLLFREWPQNALFTRRNKLKYLLALGERARAVDLASVFMNLISLMYGRIRFVWSFLLCAADDVVNTPWNRRWPIRWIIVARSFIK